MSMRELTFIEAILEAQRIALKDERVILIGEGVPDPKHIFGTTKGLKDEFPTRVFDSPVSEAGVTGICIGAAVNGLKPIMTHQRMDFSLYAMDQIVNNAAKWYSMFGGQRPVPMVIRMIIGRGWGQGNQHSQNLAALYAHIPGLKVVMPSNPTDAKGLFLQAVMDRNPVIFLEHKWLQNMKWNVPHSSYTTPFRPTLSLTSRDSKLTIVSWGYAHHEAYKAAKALQLMNLGVDLIDLKCLKPIEWEPILKSASHTQKLMVVDDAWKTGSIASEIVATVVESTTLSTPPVRICYPDHASPSTNGLSKYFYRGAKEIYEEALKMVGKTGSDYRDPLPTLHDVDPFTGKVTSAI